MNIMNKILGLASLPILDDQWSQLRDLDVKMTEGILPRSPQGRRGIAWQLATQQGLC